MPLPNDPQAGDQYNTQGYRSNPIKLPQSSDFGVLRLDHDFGNSRNHFMVSDRYYRYSQLTSNQGGHRRRAAGRHLWPGRGNRVDSASAEGQLSRARLDHQSHAAPNQRFPLQLHS